MEYARSGSIPRRRNSRRAIHPAISTPDASRSPYQRGCSAPIRKTYGLDGLGMESAITAARCGEPEGWRIVVGRAGRPGGGGALTSPGIPDRADLWRAFSPFWPWRSGADRPRLYGMNTRLKALMTGLVVLVGVGTLSSTATATTLRPRTVLARDINAVRAQHGLRAVTPSLLLRLAAQRHSDDMVTRDYFGHTAP